MKELVLASQSPRRQELMATLGYPFTICPAVGEEVIDQNLEPSHLVMSLAKQKAEEVIQKYPLAVVIGADTVVVLQGVIFGKPKTEKEAFSMLKALQGDTHTVYTGVCLMEQGKETHLSFCATKVKMMPLSDGDIKAYIAAGESMDKAGAYGIQGKGAWLMEGIEGDYFNVVGLPLCTLGQELKKFDIHLLGSEGAS